MSYTQQRKEDFSSLPIPILLEVISQLDISDFDNLFRLDHYSQTRFRSLFENYIVARQQRVFEWAINLSKSRSDDKLLLHILEKSIAFNHFYIDPSAEGNYAIKRTCHENYDKVVAFLLKDPRVDPNVDDNYALDMAVAGNCYETVALLLQDPRVDPTAYNNHAIQQADFSGNYRIVDLLLQDPRVKSSWDGKF